MLVITHAFKHWQIAEDIYSVHAFLYVSVKKQTHA